MRALSVLDPQLQGENWGGANGSPSHELGRLGTPGKQVPFLGWATSSRICEIKFQEVTSAICIVLDVALCDGGCVTDRRREWVGTSVASA